MRFWIVSSWSVGFDDKIGHGFGIKVNFFLFLSWAVVPGYHPAPHTNFSKEKRKKKKAVWPCGRFLKSQFFGWNTTRRVEILAKTQRAWTCFFEYLQHRFALFFFIFILTNFSRFMMYRFFVVVILRRFGKGYKIPVRILYPFLGFGFMCALISE